ncbi:unnamed protein product [Calicophoron daubneyi]|uniref:Coiled-coil domain-containing protein 108 n=1 Tax=Calicophoron daubneyi TaxID=300641 RepID=A0AAV2U0C6_CALDB
MDRNQTKRLDLRVIGVAESANLIVVPSTMNCGAVLVGTKTTLQMKLQNISQASSYFVLTSRNLNDDPLAESNLDEQVEQMIAISPASGWICGLSSVDITVSLQPRVRAVYNLQVFYQLWTPVDPDQVHPGLTHEECVEQGIALKTLTEPIPVSNVLLSAMYPTLRITDIHGAGSLESLGAVELWRDLGLDNLNTSLSTEPTPLELADRISTRARFRDDPELLKQNGPVIDFLVGVSVAFDETSPLTTYREARIHLLIENTSSVDAFFAFLFPDDLQIKLPTWAETGNYFDEELHQKRLQADHTFEVLPRKALLKPGENKPFEITYRHITPGADHLPVLLKIDGGREIKLNLLGITLPQDQPYLHLPQRRYIFPPAPLDSGDSRLGCLYRLQLRNPSACLVRFRVAALMSAEGLEESCRPPCPENDQEFRIGGVEYEMPVLNCITPQGVIPPDGFWDLRWRFRPLEARTYNVYCPIDIYDASLSCTGQGGNEYKDTVVIELVAVAYDRRVFGSNLVPAHPQKVRLPTATEQHSIPMEHTSLMLGIRRDQESQGIINATPRRLNLEGSWVQMSHHLLDLNQTVLGSRTRRMIHMSHIFPSKSHDSVGLPPSYRYLLHTRMPEDAELYDEDKEGNYKKELQAWLEESERQKVEFIITDQKQTSSQQPTGQIYREKQKFGVKFDDTISGERKSSDRNSENMLMVAGRRWCKPMPPKPGLLHFTITAQIVNHGEMQSSNEMMQQCQFIDSTLFMHPGHTICKSMCREGQTEVVTTLQWNLCSDILTCLLHGLTQDPEFIAFAGKAICPPYPTDTTDDQPDDPVPVWTQIRGRIQMAGGDSCQQSPDILNSDDFGQSSEIPKLERAWSTVEENTQSVRTDSLETRENYSVMDEDADYSCIQNPAFKAIVEDTLACMIRNIVAEADEREVDLTTRFRAITLPPRDLSKLDRNRSESPDLKQEDKTAAVA